MEDINDIYGPYETPLPLWFWFLVFLGIFIVIFSLIVFYNFYIKKPKKEVAKVKTKRKISPEERLHISVLKLQKEVKNLFADEISKKLAQEIRIFLGDSKYTDSLKKTTSETLRSLKKTKISATKLNLIADILKMADGVKFADKKSKRAKILELIEGILDNFF